MFVLLWLIEWDGFSQMWIDLICNLDGIRRAEKYIALFFNGVFQEVAFPLNEIWRTLNIWDTNKVVWRGRFACLTQVVDILKKVENLKS